MQVRKLLTFLFVVMAIMLATAVALAEEAGGTGGSGIIGEKAIKALAAAFSIGIAALGGALGQGRAVAGALEGMARNPNVSGKLFTTMILGLAIIESLVIYALIISFVVL
jgi:F-type H+-transporting ATPase subunit c